MLTRFFLSHIEPRFYSFFEGFFSHCLNFLTTRPAPLSAVVVKAIVVALNTMHFLCSFIPFARVPFSSPFPF